MATILPGDRNHDFGFILGSWSIRKRSSLTSSFQDAVIGSCSCEQGAEELDGRGVMAEGHEP